MWNVELWEGVSVVELSCQCGRVGSARMSPSERAAGGVSQPGTRNQNFFCLAIGMAFRECFQQTERELVESVQI